MTTKKLNTYKRAKQRRLRLYFYKNLIMHMIIVIAIMLIACTSLVNTSEKNKIEGEDNTVVHESIDKQEPTAPPANDSPTEPIVEHIEETEPEPEEVEQFDRGLDDHDKHLLAKLAMAEAEGESFETKVKILMVVLNRTEANGFPNTIEEVIFQKTKDTYQFSPVAPGGRWWTTEPNEECWEAVEFVNEMPDDVSGGALYFEACKGESWHSRNLTFICESDNTRFYK